MRTLTVKSGGGGQFNFDAGWHEVEISSAKYGTYEATPGESKQYVDVLLKEYPPALGDLSEPPDRNGPTFKPKSQSNNFTFDNICG